MNIEYDVFKRSNIDFNKLIEYGFTFDKNNYTYSKDILDGNFLVQLNITKSNKITGKIIDKEINEEYILYRNIDNNGNFVNRVRNEYIKLLNDIKDKCTISEDFMFPQSNRIVKYIKETYNDNPEFLWDNSDAGVFRNKKSDKWYGIIMNVDRSKITDGNGEIEVINVKLDEEMILSLLKEKGYYKAYHMNKKKWLSIILDDSLNDEEIFSLIDMSYNLVDK